jgi:hypothetical protein
MSLAVNNASGGKEFTERYWGLLDYYPTAMEKIQPNEPNEDGDAEQSHRRFKEAVEQALLLRGRRDFESREAYVRFLQDLVAARNAGRRKRLAEELPCLGRLPQRRLESCKRLPVRVDGGSLIHVDRNTYSVPSRLIGERVEVRLYVEHVEVWYAQREVERFERLRGRKKHRINYRHIIDWLVRKPGAFENYRYREELFPNLAARQSETAVDEALRTLLAGDQPVSRVAVEELIHRAEEVRPVTEVTVEDVDLSSFDDLFLHKEVWNELSGGCEREVDGLFAPAALADVSGVF